MSVSAAVREALAEALARSTPRTRHAVHAHRLDAIARACADLPVLDPRSADEIIDFDEHGLPR